ncbi:MAG TPA: Fe-S cluster assembly protein SufD, partial [Candidatus Dormibacteraeota bacterium]
MSFNRAAVEQLSALKSEPGWLRARRLTAFDVYESTALPDTKRQEDWRQADLKGLDMEAYAPFQQPNGAAPSSAVGDAAAVLRQRGTSPAWVELAPELSKKGVIFMPLSEAARLHPRLVEQYLFSALKPERDKFAALHAALFSGGTFLYVPDGIVVDRPLVSQFWSAGAGAAVLPHSLVIAGKGSSFQYVDEFLSADRRETAIASGSAEV